MLNNKGQSLVLFVIILPILLLILVIVIDLGRVFSLKQELDNINKIVIDYGLDKFLNNEMLLEDDIKKMIILNKDNIDEIDIIIEDDRLEIELIDNEKGLLSRVIDKEIFLVKSNYVGYIENNEKRIEIKR